MNKRIHDEENHTRVQEVSANVNQVDNEEDIADQYTVEPSTPNNLQSGSSTDAIKQQNVFQDGESFRAVCDFRAEHCKTVVRHLHTVHYERAVLGVKECEECGATSKAVFQRRHKCLN